MGGLRLAVVGAFPFPLAQGSQVYVRDQIRAIQPLGAEVTLFCYGSGDGEAPDDLVVERVPRALSPGALRAGPSPGKPVADSALAAGLLAAHRRRPFDAVLAHNGEAALAALLARSGGGAPVVYVAHTLLEHELPTFVPAPLRGAARASGRALDSWIASRADGVIALCHDAATRLARHARGPVETIAPGLDPEPAPDPARIAGACERQGLPPGRFALYTGNVDGYQGLDLIAHAARSAPDVHWVVATHGERGPAGRQVVCVRTSPEEARLLLYGCGVALLPRRCPGGFPIKLLNYLEAARPVVAFEGVADGLVHGDSAWLLERDAEPDAFRDAALALLRDEARGDRIGAAGRVHLEQRHGWRDAALRTLLFCAETAKR